MDRRYNDVKVLLKNWEQSFVEEHKRKPNKEDIDGAPEETRKLYKEYRSLKMTKENSNSQGHTDLRQHQNQTQNQTQNQNQTQTKNQSQSQTQNQPAAEKEADCWGAHLNRRSRPAAPPSLTPQDRQSLQASAQYYGMKLKSNLGALTKERPLSLRKSLTPGLSSGLPSAGTPSRTPGLSAGPSAGTPGRTPGLSAGFSAGTPGRTPGLSAGPSAGTPGRTPGLSAGFSAGTPGRTPGLSAGLSVGRTPLRSWGDAQSGQSPSPADTLSPLSRPANTCPLSPAPPLPRPANTCLLSPAPPLTRPARTCPLSPGPLQQDLSEPPLPAFSCPSPAPQGRGQPQLPRPSLTARLSAVDSGWLQRCQVFGEVEEGERPVVGNLSFAPSSAQACSPAGSELNSSQTGGVVNQADPGGLEEQTGHTLPAITPSNARKRRSTARKPRSQEKGALEIQAQPEGSGEEWSNGKKARKRGRDSEEHRENAGEEEEEEGKRKRRRTRKTESPQGGGAKPAARRRKGRSQAEDDVSEEAEEEEGVNARVPSKDPQENLLGEVDEEDVRAARTRTKQPAGPRASRNSEGNFVKINLKKKSHVKGFALRGAALRKQMYMQKFQLKGERFGGGVGRGRGRFSGFSRQGDSCYKCGGTGHWARDCRGPAPPPATAVEAEPVEEEPLVLPTLEEVARATGTLCCEPLAPPGGREEQQQAVGEEVLLNVIRPDYERPAPPAPMDPLYSLGEDGQAQAAPAEVYEALKAFGYQSFRPGQESAIMRILSGLSTLVVLSTGMGKSLCYQLPAYLYAQRSSCITLVVSPLVSLMDDQLSGLPAKLKAACIHSNMSRKQREAAIEKVKSGEVHVLLLSPEALVGGGHSGSGCLPPADQLPPVAFACIDEAHCVSEWSHNFRPCYLRLCKVLRDRLGVRCLLGLTATATLSTALDIAQHLDILDHDGIAIRSAAVPNNLHLSVSTDRDKDQALVSLLKGERFGGLDSVIVYCTRREETSRISALLRTCLQGVLLRETARSSGKDDNPVEKKKKALARKKVRKPLKWVAESYHAGLSAAERRRVQNNFMCGELRVVVATVAFGMGLDKSDVRGIVHYNMPKSFESYVQEIGRAGRDGEPAHCHLFLDPEGGDLHELRRHIYADTVDYYSVKRLVQKVFPACKCSQIHHKHQQLAREVGDSELLELMDIYDQAATDNPPAEQVEQSTQPAEARDGPLHLPAEGGQREPQDRSAPVLQRGAETEEQELGKQEMEHTEGGSDSLKVEEGQPDGDCDWPSSRVCHTHERAIPIQETVEALDITEEGLETLLCYLELHSQRWVELLHPTLACCRLVCYGGPAQIRTLTRICPPVAVVLARKRMAGERVEACDSLEFDVVEVADTMGWQLPLVKRGLRQLQWSFDRGSGRSGVLVEFSKLSFYLRSYGDLSAEEMDRVCDFLHGRVVTQERTQLYQLTACFRAFRSVAYQSVNSCVDQLEEGRSLQLKCMLGDYFDKRRELDLSHTPTEEEESLSKYKLQDWEEQIRADIRSFLANRSDEKFSGRAVARILHGIGSPCYPAQVYGRDRRYWRKYIQFDFNQIIRLATQEIIKFK